MERFVCTPLIGLGPQEGIEIENMVRIANGKVTLLNITNLVPVCERPALLLLSLPDSIYSPTSLQYSSSCILIRLRLQPNVPP